MMDAAILSDYVLLIISGFVGLIFTTYLILYKTIEGVKKDFHALEIRIARDHLTKSELREMLREQEARINAQLKHYFSTPKGTDHER